MYVSGIVGTVSVPNCFHSTLPESFTELLLEAKMHTHSIVPTIPHLDSQTWVETKPSAEKRKETYAFIASLYHSLMVTIPSRRVSPEKSDHNYEVIGHTFLTSKQALIRILWLRLFLKVSMWISSSPEPL